MTKPATRVEESLVQIDAALDDIAKGIRRIPDRTDRAAGAQAVKEVRRNLRAVRRHVAAVLKRARKALEDA